MKWRQPAHVFSICSCSLSSPISTLTPHFILDTLAQRTFSAGFFFGPPNGYGHYAMYLLYYMYLRPRHTSTADHITHVCLRAHTQFNRFINMTRSHRCCPDVIISLNYQQINSQCIDHIVWNYTGIFQRFGQHITNDWNDVDLSKEKTILWWHRLISFYIHSEASDQISNGKCVPECASISRCSSALEWNDRRKEK